MNQNPYLKEYQKNQIETASQEQLLIMLYNGAIQFLNVAKKAISENDIEGTHNNIIRAQRIITEFKATLDMEMGGEIAQNLFALYTYLNKCLVKANINRDIGLIDEVLGHLKGLRDTWVQAIKIAGKEKKKQDQEEREEILNKDFEG